MIPGFGEEAQTRLKESSAFVTRAGGLGGTVAMYLAAAGIGKLVIAHGGNLTPSNLNRMLLQTQDWLGKPRVERIRESILRFNSDVDLTVIAEYPNDQNVGEWVKDVDVVCDCTPNFDERFILNRAIVAASKPMVEAAMNNMEGYLTVIVPGETPCLACMYPEPPDWWHHLGFPVLGAVAGTVGCLAAIETIKMLTGFAEPLKGRLLCLDTLLHDYRKYRIRRDPECEVCGHL